MIKSILFSRHHHHLQSTLSPIFFSIRWATECRGYRRLRGNLLARKKNWIGCAECKCTVFRRYVAKWRNAGTYPPLGMLTNIPQHSSITAVTWQYNTNFCIKYSLFLLSYLSKLVLDCGGDNFSNSFTWLESRIFTKIQQLLN